MIDPPTSTTNLRKDRAGRKPELDAVARLLSWYDQNRRHLPWRALPGERANPYHVLVSEAMLQQTTVATVKPRFLAFIDRFANLHALADAALDDVLHAWQGLGYYRRARLLHACAQAVIDRFDGKIPTGAEQLRSLPGIGDYSAAAIAAIAFEQPVLPVDGNVVRVMSRYLGIDQTAAKAKPIVTQQITSFVPATRRSDLAQALMELGALCCKPKSPDCRNCPWSQRCWAHQSGEPSAVPRTKVKLDRPECSARAYLVVSRSRHVMMRKRPDQGLLAGMIDLPSSPYDATTIADDGHRYAPIQTTNWQPVPGQIRHLFTHRALTVELWHLSLTAKPAPPPECFWHDLSALNQLALPTLTRKLLRHAGLEHQSLKPPTTAP